MVIWWYCANVNWRFSIPAWCTLQLQTVLVADRTESHSDCVADIIMPWIRILPWSEGSPEQRYLILKRSFIMRGHETHQDWVDENRLGNREWTLKQPFETVILDKAKSIGRCVSLINVNNEGTMRALCKGRCPGWGNASCLQDSILPHRIAYAWSMSYDHCIIICFGNIATEIPTSCLQPPIGVWSLRLLLWCFQSELLWQISEQYCRGKKPNYRP